MRGKPVQLVASSHLTVDNYLHIAHKMKVKINYETINRSFSNSKQ